MQGLTAPELCELVGMNHQRFETLRRRFRKALLEAKVLDENTPVFPVEHNFVRTWARYGYRDALSLSITLELERCGMAFKEAARIARSASRQYLDDLGSSRPFWAGRQTIAMETGERFDLFVCGDVGDAFTSQFSDASLLVVIACNVSEIAGNLGSAMQERGYKIEGNEVAKTDDAQ